MVWCDAADSVTFRFQAAARGKSSADDVDEDGVDDDLADGQRYVALR